MKQLSDLKPILTQAGIKPSQQRLAVVSFLANNLIHPTVDEIYSGLLPEYPTMSRTTVYNTVRLLEEADRLEALTLDGDSTRYDFNTSPHSHFFCTRCHRVTDLPMPPVPEAPGGFEVQAVQLCYKGICPQCAAGKNQTIN
ncbi:MAG: transcriptional repressor [Paramuribaculum sp.]|nr:transcriptional repressor [Paramuribaculum sp.]MDE6323612.1 transcriptional repressor [Paramuribaculum sp.]